MDSLSQVPFPNLGSPAGRGERGVEQLKAQAAYLKSGICHVTLVPELLAGNERAETKSLRICVQDFIRSVNRGKRGLFNLIKFPLDICTVYVCVCFKI